MAIHKTSHEQEMSPEDAKRLGLFLFTVKPNVAKPGALPSGGPVYLLGKMIGGMENPTSAKIWNSVGWTLGLQSQARGAAQRRATPRKLPQLDS